MKQKSKSFGDVLKILKVLYLRRECEKYIEKRSKGTLN
jgi:hypothetical protein